MKVLWEYVTVANPHLSSPMSMIIDFFAHWTLSI